MCLSAPVSFAVASLTGIVGIANVRRASGWREVPLASIPLVFAVQQGAEGALWLTLGNDPYAPRVSLIANAFVFLALVAWPLWAPLAAGLVERERERRLGIAAIFVLAMLVATLGFWNILAQPYTVCVVQNSLSYSNGHYYSPLELALYILCTCGPFLISSHKELRGFGITLVAGLLVSSVLYVLVFVSIWCFFAAASSLTVLLYFVRARKREAARPGQ